MVLPNDSDEKWKYSEHTKVKHTVFSKYFKVWSNILGTYHDLNIFDCFAGRGRYVDGNDGSPLKILNILVNLKNNQNKPEQANCHFIEENSKNFENLSEEIEKFRSQNDCNDWLNIEIYHDEFTNVIDRILDKYGENVSPAFFFLDPFGFSGIPLKVIKKLLEYPKTEVFITFMTRDVNRFLNSPPHTTAIQELFGSEDVLEKLNQEPYRQLKNEQAILKLYRNQLHEEANVKYTFPFQVKADSNLQTVYYLIHCTNHPLGCKLMKAIMYRSGTLGKFGYFGPAEGQLSLDIFYGVEDLKKYLLNRFENRKIAFSEMIHETLMETGFIEKHYRKAIIELERENRVIIYKKGSRQGIKNYTLIVFKESKRNLFDFKNNMTV